MLDVIFIAVLIACAIAISIGVIFDLRSRSAVGDTPKTNRMEASQPAAPAKSVDLESSSTAPIANAPIRKVKSQQKPKPQAVPSKIDNSAVDKADRTANLAKVTAQDGLDFEAPSSPEPLATAKRIQEQILQLPFVVELSPSGISNVAVVYLRRAAQKWNNADVEGAVRDFGFVLERDDVSEIHAKLAHDALAILKAGPGEEREMNTEETVNGLLNRILAKETLEWGRVISDCDEILSRQGASGGIRQKALFIRGTAKQWINDQVGAEADFDAIVAEAAPSEIRSRALVRRGVIRVNSRRAAIALSDFDAAADAAETPADVLPLLYLNRAMTKMELGDIAGELSDLAHVIDLPTTPGPVKAKALDRRSRMLRDAGDAEGFRADLDAIVAIQDAPSIAGFALMQRAGIKYESGDKAGALEDYRAILQLEGADLSERRGAQRAIASLTSASS